MHWVLILFLLSGQQNKKPAAPAIAIARGAWNDAEPRGRTTERDGFEHPTLWELYTLPGARVRCGEVVAAADSEDHLRYVVLIDGHSIFPIYYADQQAAEDKVQQVCDA